LPNQNTVVDRHFDILFEREILELGQAVEIHEVADAAVRIS
jgi:hypothetical protein